MKYLGINLIKEVKDFFNKNYEILMKEIEKDIKNVKVFCVYRLEELI